MNYKIIMWIMLIIIIIFILVITFLRVYNKHNDLHYKKYIAIINSDKNNSKNIKGKIFFEELKNGLTKIHGYINGLPKGYHGFHIHESGNLTNGCDSLKGHYNPFNKQHGGRLKKNNGKLIFNNNRHVGDLGNLYSSECGNCYFSFNDPLIKLRGPTNILGRSVVIHKNKDDEGLGNFKDSKTTGHSGERIACGIIVIP